jgi:hypothetical protein
MVRLVRGDAVYVCFADDGVALATHGRVAACVFRAPLTLERLRRLRLESEPIQLRFGIERVNLTVVEPSAVGSLPDDVRKESAALMREFPATMTATVLEGAGFRIAAARAILSGLTLLAGERQRRRMFESVADAAAWVEERNVAGTPEMTAGAVATLVQRARSALKQP